MNFDAVGDNIKGLLTSTRTYVVPRFQRDFSWNENNYKELLNDLLKQINFSTENETIKFTTSQYYLGNMIFSGMKDAESVKIIDGQQRLTTGTILLAAIRDSLYEASTKEYDLAYNYAETTQNEYLVKKIDGTPQRKLETTTSYPYFTETIQGYTNSDKEMSPSNDEEIALEKSFTFFKNQLIKNKLLHKFQGLKYSKKNENDTFISALKALRDQFLNSEIVEIFVTDDNQAHRIFENINSKGKPLSQVDLIKNDIFSKIKIDDVGVDRLSLQWQKINSTLSVLDTNFNEFFLHLWKSRYPSDSANGSNLYKKYTEKFKDDDADYSLLKSFLKDLEESSNIYAKIIDPSLDDFKKQEEKVIYQSLVAINKFRGVQSRVALLSLFNSKQKLKQNKKNDFLKFLADFHMAAFGTELNVRSNLTTSLYKSFCSQVEQAKTQNDVYKAMDSLKKSLLRLITRDDFINNFIKLAFKKKTSRTSFNNYPTSYAIKAIADKMDNRQYNDDEYSIEHILDESGNKKALSNIGNISVLERKYNDQLCTMKSSNSIANINYKISIYKKSSYNMTRLISIDFKEEAISKRATYLAEYFWDNFLEINV